MKLLQTFNQLFGLKSVNGRQEQVTDEVMIITRSVLLEKAAGRGRGPVTPKPR
jgi:hypothetical protein